MISYVARRAKWRGLHGRRHIDRQRVLALLLIVTGLIRVIAWVTLIVLYAIGVHFTHALFLSVAFVALISLYANAATDFGQVCASLAQLGTADAHHDAEAVRRTLTAGVTDLENDIARLATLSPCEEADALALSIQAQIRQLGH